MPNNSITRALYQHDASIDEHTTEVQSCRPATDLTDVEKPLFKIAEEGDHVVATRETIFHPQGGGQPSDTGIMTLDVSSASPSATFDVKLARKTPNGSILHLGTFSASTGAPTTTTTTFPPRAVVTQSIDVPRRRLHSRLHTAGHLIGLAVRSSPDISIISEGKANHAPGASFVEFVGLIPGELRAAIEERANALVEQDLAVEVRWWEPEVVRERCAAVPDVLPVGEGEDLRVVEIVGVGSYPCGGTHLPRTKEVGKITIKGIKRQKGISKVSYSVEV